MAESSSPPPPPPLPEPEPVASHAVVARDARAADAEAVAAIGSAAFPLAYAGVLRPTVITAIVEQMYSPTVVTGSINHVSRASLEKLERYKASKGWTFPWWSSYGSDFNYDFHITMDRLGRCS